MIVPGAIRADGRPALQRNHGGEEWKWTEIKEKRILLVDDEQELLDMVCSILKKKDIRTSAASCMESWKRQRFSPGDSSAG